MTNSGSTLTQLHNNQAARAHLQSRVDLQKCFDLLDVQLGDVAVDLGCGSAPTPYLLAQSAGQVHAIDKDPTIANPSRFRGWANIEPHLTDASNTPFALKSKSVDRVLASMVFHYINDWSLPLREVRRVLNSAGIAVISVHHPLSDFLQSNSKNYLATEAWVHDIDLHWRRPLSAMFEAFAAANLAVKHIDECCEQDQGFGLYGSLIFVLN